MKIIPITICLWFDHQAEEAANFYTSVFRNSDIDSVSRYGNEGFEIHGKKAGSVMSVNFTINGQPFSALNGGPIFKFNEAVSFQVFCETQEEIDFYWDKLTDGGEEVQCGWLKDRYGVSWQIIPTVLSELLSDPEKSEKVTKAFLQMKKFDIKELMKV
jgi:predicted 3-demethylubiquinone-9 3-methyltransferase (glyoxalase superfamily)